MSAAMLSVEHLSVVFGGLRAVNDVSFEVQPGEVFTLIGPNGAGKTTVFNLISRIYEPSSGSLRFGGEDLARLAPHDVAGRGIARTFQNIELFEHASVLQGVEIDLAGDRYPASVSPKAPYDPASLRVKS